jgi:hypothetical protein
MGGCVGGKNKNPNDLFGNTSTVPPDVAAGGAIVRQ